MNIDLGSPVLDIAIGLSFIFFLLSVIASAIAEFFAGALNLRAKTLVEGLEGMIGDRKAVEKVLGNPLVRTDLTKETPSLGKRFSIWRRLEGLLPFRSWRKYERTVSYIAPAAFAAAFTKAFKEVKDVEIPASHQKAQTGRRLMKEQVAQLRGGSATATPPPISLEKWFNDGMERVSGWYKRKSQLILIIVAAIVAFGLNASALRIAQALETDPGLRAVVVKKAEEVSAEPEAVASGRETSEEAKKRKEEEAEQKKEQAGMTSTQIEEADGAGEIRTAGKTSSKALGELDELKLPIFWGHQNVPTGSFSGIAHWLAGILITILAISLGAPFWFDTLGRLSNLRMAGEKPEAKSPTTG